MLLKRLPLLLILPSLHQNIIAKRFIYLHSIQLGSTETARDTL